VLVLVLVLLLTWCCSTDERVARGMGGGPW